MNTNTHSPFVLTGVMGWPISHSRSPLIHGHWLAQLGLRGAYLPLPVNPLRLTEALTGLSALGFAGCNLTLPHKVQALDCISEIDLVAQQIGAVNTVIVQADGSLRGTNTDAFGYMQSLREAQPAWPSHPGPAVVLGAGGAARAVVWALADAGATEIRLLNRSLDKAQAIAKAFGMPVNALPWADRHAALADANLLVNTTTQGMQGQEPLDIALDDLPAHAVVSDIVYTPLQTDLLLRAQARGNPTVGGLGMLLHQARPGFAAWFGVMPEVTSDLWKAVLASF
ncbi:MAG: shikimate dehydrogenase [Betaproteobacteria bacterium]|nr:shikimate dehydrogenase [Betaproteobacteria bacterium]